jgi:hypothetical protein
LVGFCCCESGMIRLRTINGYASIQRPLVCAGHTANWGRALEKASLGSGAYVKWIGTTKAITTVKQHLAAIGMCFDWQVTGHLIERTRHGVFTGS